MKSALKLCLVLMALGVVCLGGATTAHAAYLSSDGNCGSQSDGVSLVAPWNSGGISGTPQPAGGAASQSPFTNVFTGNAMGIYWTNTASGPYFLQTITEITSNTASFVYMNADVKIPTSGTGGFRLIIGRAGGASASAVVLVKSTGLFAQDAGGAGTAICGVLVDTWYNIQLTFDMKANTYSGAVIKASTTERTLISSRSFCTASAGITTIGSDVTVGNVGCRIDNWVLSDAALPAPPYIDTGYLTTDGNFGNQSDNVAIVSPWNNPMNVAYGSASSQSPFANIFATNGMGAYWTNTDITGPYFAQQFVEISSNATGLLYMNVDFMVPVSGAGGFRLVIANSSYAGTLIVYVSSLGIYASSASGVGTMIMMREVGVWYNLQITLDMTANTYSGMITREGTLVRTPISSRSFEAERNMSIIFADIHTGSVGVDANAGCRIDNWVLGTSPMNHPTPPRGTVFYIR